MDEQIQIEKKDDKIEEDEDLEEEMKEMVKDLKEMRQGLNQATNHVQEQDKRLVGINDKLDDYNNKVDKGDQYMDFINKGPFDYIKDKIVGWFTFTKEPNTKLNSKDNEILEKARNKQIDNDEVEMKEDKDWTIIQRKEKNEDDIIEEALKEARGMRKDVQKFTSAVSDSNKVVDITNKNVDISLNNVNKVNKKMKNHK